MPIISALVSASWFELEQPVELISGDIKHTQGGDASDLLIRHSKWKHVLPGLGLYLIGNFPHAKAK